MIMTEEQKLKYDLLKECGYDMNDKAQSEEITPASFVVFGVTEGFIRMTFRGVYNYLGSKGEYLSDTWFDYAGDFHEKFARAKFGDKWNHIGTNGKLLSSTWFDDVENFHDGRALVKLNGEQFYIDKQGKRINDSSTQPE